MKSLKTSAHGRVNLIGEHTDYNGGWVLPTAIPQSTVLHFETRADQKIICKSEQQTEALSFEIGREARKKTWIDYLQGATYLAGQRGLPLGGLDVQISSSVPMGSGLSSSAALEIAFLKGLNELFSWRLEARDLALIAQSIENDFVGARVGIMDQMACSFCEFGEALFLDTLNLTSERVSLPMDAMDLLVINSGVSHRLTDGGYNQRRAECEKASADLGVKSLRELGPQDLAKVEKATSEVCFKRARHVLTENERVHQVVEAFKARDLARVGALFYESHKSMRDDYQVSVPEIDLLVELCQADSQVFGARLTGGGFGGSIVAVTQKGKASEVAQKIIPKYKNATQQNASLLLS